MKVKLSSGKQPGSNVILSMVQREPCSIRQIANSCNSTSYDVVRCLSGMVRNGQVLVKYINGQLFVASTD